MNNFTDDSGKIHVSVWQEVSRDASDLHTEVVNNIADEDPTLVCIGEGGKGSGDLLTASHPIDDFKGWAVSSKSHITPDPTAITVWGSSI